MNSCLIMAGACLVCFLAASQTLGAEAGTATRLDGTREVYLSLAHASRAECGWGKAHDCASVTGTQLRVGSQAFDRGIGTHAPAELVFRPDGRYRWLTFYAGISADMTEKGSIVVQVWLDGRKVHETPVMRVKEEPLYVSLPVIGARELRLVGTDAGDGNAADHVNLGNLRLSVAEQEPGPDGLPPPVFKGEVAPPESPLTLWYRRPAERWLDALPVGNGRLGAMVFGGLRRERLALNESTFWSGAPSDKHDNPAGGQRIAEIRQLFFDEKYKEAVGLTARCLLGRRDSYGTHLPVGDLLLDFRHVEGEVRDYCRALDLDEAISRVGYSIGGVRFSREVLASHVDGVMAVRFSADAPGAISFQARFRGSNGPCLTRAEGGDSLVAAGNAWEKKHSDGKTGVSFQATIRVLAQGGDVAAEGDVLEVTEADAVTLLIAINTDYRGGSPAKLCAEQIKAASEKSYEDLRRAHMRDHQRLFRRVSLDLGVEARAVETPTDERRARLREGAHDPQLLATFFQYGRYLMIAGSREDSPLPTNLQGLWNDNIACGMGWTCDFHLDINTQQNYWPAEVCNLSECHEPLFRLIESLREPGRRTARVVYGVENGWVCHVFTNAWGYTAPGWGLGWGMHPVGGIWIAQHMWQHYLFTGDREFLARRAYPVLRGAAEFFLDYMVEHPKHGYLVTGPSVSPENAFVAPDGSRVSESMGPTHDRVVVYDLFTACIEGSRALGVDADFRAKLESARAKLPPLKIGRHGQLQEWLEDFEEAVPNHRHTSHLAALCPSAQITPRTTADLAHACRVSLERRMNRPDWEDVEWSRANAVNYYARLADGNAARRNVVSLVSELSADNLFTLSVAGVAGAQENVFSIDGNYAGAAGIAEMLLQSHGGEIELLPALPKAWPSGSVRGLRARGGFEVDAKWSDGKLAEATVRCLLDNACRLRCGEATMELTMRKGDVFRWAP